MGRGLQIHCLVIGSGVVGLERGRSQRLEHPLTVLWTVEGCGIIWAGCEPALSLHGKCGSSATVRHESNYMYPSHLMFVLLEDAFNKDANRYLAFSGSLDEVCNKLIT